MARRKPPASIGSVSPTLGGSSASSHGSLIGPDLSGERHSELPLGPLVKEVLGWAYSARRPVLLEGATGIGKSEVVAQVAEELGIGYCMLDLSLLEPPDLVGLPVLANGRTAYASPQCLPTEGHGILMLEELNRAERYIQQPALQLLTARRLHQYELPSGWAAFAAINPEHADYQVTPLDPALRSRFLNLRVRADRAAWLEWAIAHHIHPAVLALAREHDGFLADVAPRSWTYASQLLCALPSPRPRRSVLTAALGGYLSASWVEVLLDKLEHLQETEGLEIAKLLSQYHRDESLRRSLLELRDSGRLDALEAILFRLNDALRGPEFAQLVGRQQFELAAFEALLRDLPGDFREQLCGALHDQPAMLRHLDIDVDRVLSRDYPGGELWTRVRGLIADPLRKAYLPLIARALKRRLENHENVAALRLNRGAKAGLAAFVEQAGESARPLVELARRLELLPA